MDQLTFRAFVNAVVHDQSRAAQMLRDHPQLSTARGPLGETALHFLAVEDYVEGVRFLIDAGADPNLPNQFGDSPIIDVALLGHSDVAALLLKGGADPNAPSRTRDNAVHAAVSAGHSLVLDLLLAAGGRWNYSTDLGEEIWDALDIAPHSRAQLEDVLARHGVRRPTNE